MRIIADDLTGAADAGVCFVHPGAPVTLLLYPAQRIWKSVDPCVVCVDTATRDADQATATARLWSLAQSVAPGQPLLKKVDSTLRGHLAAEMGVLTTLRTGSTIILAPAFPRTGRTTSGGVQNVDGVPITSSRPIRDLLGTVRSAEISLRTVRAGGPRLADALRSAQSRAPVVVCDAETDSDLDAVVEAGERADGEVVWAGSAGLAAALARLSTSAKRWSGSVACRRPISSSAAAAHFVAVVGSKTPVAFRQAEALVGEFDADFVSLPIDTLSNADPTMLDRLQGELADRAASRSLVVLLCGRGMLGCAVDQVLGFVTAAATTAASTLVLAGGTTARAVLEAAGVESLALHEEVGPGVVLSATDRGQHVVTKAGGFGDDRSLVRALEHVCREC